MTDANSRSKVKILFVTPEIRWPLQSGGDIRQWHTLRALSELASHLDVVVIQPDSVPPPIELSSKCKNVWARNKQLASKGDKVAEQYRSTIGRLRLAVTYTRPFEWLTCERTSQHSWFKEIVEAGKYDVIWISKALQAMFFTWKDRSRTILDGDDFDSVREYTLLRNSAWYGAKVANYLNVLKLGLWELTLPLQFAVVARCSEADRRRLPFRNVVVLPNGADVPDRSVKKLACAPRILFVGSLGYAPNSNGLIWFIDKIWPSIRAARPDICLDVVGGGAPVEITGHHHQNGIFIHGFVEDLAPFYQQAAISIAPLLAGGGTRLKILESLAFATPVVATSLGAYGLELNSEQGVYCEDSPAAFSGRCLALLNDVNKLQYIGEQGYVAVKSLYDWAAIRRRMQAVAMNVANQRKRHRT